RMHLDLIADERLAGKPRRFLEQGDGEIRHPDMARKPAALDLAKRADGFSQRHLGVRPMQQQKVHAGKPQARKAVAGSARKRTRRKMRCHTLVTMKSSSRAMPEARRPSPTSLSLSYISAVFDLTVAEMQRLRVQVVPRSSQVPSPMIGICAGGRAGIIAFTLRAEVGSESNSLK